MTEGKSTLNPHATPYVPLFSRKAVEWQKPADTPLGDSGNKEDTIRPAELQLPDSVSVDYEVPSFEKLGVSGESSSKMSPQDYSDEFFQDLFPEFDVQTLMDDPKLKLEYLSSMFPDISADSLAELLSAHGGDLNVTIDVVQQLEWGGDSFQSSLQDAETGTSSTPQMGNKLDL